MTLSILITLLSQLRLHYISSTLDPQPRIHWVIDHSSDPSSKTRIVTLCSIMPFPLRMDSLSNWADSDHMGILNGKNIFRESAPARKQIVDFPVFGLNKLCLCLQKLQLG